MGIEDQKIRTLEPRKGAPPEKSESKAGPPALILLEMTQWAFHGTFKTIERTLALVGKLTDIVASVRKQEAGR